MPRQDSTCSSRAPSGAPPSGSDVKPEDLHLDRVKALLQDRSREYGLANLLQRVVGLVEEAISDGELSCALQADLTAWLREAREFDGP